MKITNPKQQIPISKSKIKSLLSNYGGMMSEVWKREKIR